MEQLLLNYISKKSSIFLYRGSFINKPSLVISDIVEDIMASKFSRKIKNRTLFLLIEITQNIEKYSEHNINFKDWFLVSNVKEGVIIQSRNTVKTDNLPELKGRLEKISSSNREELNSLFTETLTKSLEVEKISPGLGLIEMKRRNKKAFDYSFQELDNEFSAFQITLFIGEGESEAEEEEIKRLNQLTKQFSKDTETMIYAGSFEGAAVSSIIKLFEKLKLSQNQVITSKYQHCIIEKIQNAKEHGYKIEDSVDGFFLLEKEHGKITTVCCNRTDNPQIIESRISNLNSLSDQELNDANKNALLDFNNEGGLGLIQVAKYTRPSPLLSKTFYTDNKECYFYLRSIYK